MEFVVRYWSSLLPRDFVDRRSEPRWVDYSIHPGSKIGLHNALLAMHDRCEIMQAHGCRFECAVFVVEGERSERLSETAAARIFASLPRGDVKWLDIKDFVLPEPVVQALPEEAATPETSTLPETLATQLSLFPRMPTPYDDVDEPPRLIDVDT
ncbi:hypothetical protein [Propionivibrio dicarboxylicus]|uniref:Uncharacterized protein n=1 Tax=Propionivibrio dicarboxylicus TaxID=83767 RepID=A0A1G7XTL5_9RHOO|nr:hypothetical protein [Propionivibrio dicarboxylicus]SDG87471.1 hypothetical protein SAMN05660652_00792 [Propionivibrio dicarboxylicus]